MTVIHEGRSCAFLEKKIVDEGCIHTERRNVLRSKRLIQKPFLDHSGQLMRRCDLIILALTTHFIEDQVSDHIFNLQRLTSGQTELLSDMACIWLQNSDLDPLSRGKFSHPSNRLDEIPHDHPFTYSHKC